MCVKSLPSFEKLNITKQNFAVFFVFCLLKKESADTQTIGILWHILQLFMLWTFHFVIGVYDCCAVSFRFPLVSNMKNFRPHENSLQNNANYWPTMLSYCFLILESYKTVLSIQRFILYVGQSCNLKVIKF